MKVTPFTREMLHIRRESRKLLAAGYEEIGENGGKLWQIYRGNRTDCWITDAKVAPHGLTVWVKIEKRPPPAKGNSDET